MRSIKVLIGIILSIVLLLGIASLCFALILGIKTGLAWNELDRFESERATQWYVENPPLDLETISELCKTYSIPKNDPLCNGSKPVYAPNFFKIIKNKYELGKATYEQVNHDLGKYMYYKSNSVDIGNEIIAYEVSYDLKGDRASEITFIFTDSNILRDIVTRVGEWAK